MGTCTVNSDQYASNIVNFFRTSESDTKLIYELWGMLESRRLVVAIHVEYNKFVLCFCSNQKWGSVEVERISVTCRETLHFAVNYTMLSQAAHFCLSWTVWIFSGTSVFTSWGDLQWHNFHEIFMSFCMDRHMQLINVSKEITQPWKRHCYIEFWWAHKKERNH